MKLLTATRGGRASVRLDIVRALAAVAVVVGHTRSAFLLDAQRAEPLAPLEKVFYFLSGLGHQSVIVFFVLSGFFVGASVLAQFKGGSVRTVCWTR